MDELPMLTLGTRSRPYNIEEIDTVPDRALQNGDEGDNSSNSVRPSVEGVTKYAFINLQETVSNLIYAE